MNDSNLNISYAEYIAEQVNKNSNLNIKYAEYLIENVNKNIEYAEYIAEQLTINLIDKKLVDRKKKLNRIINRMKNI